MPKCHTEHFFCTSLNYVWGNQWQGNSGVDCEVIDGQGVIGIRFSWNDSGYQDFYPRPVLAFRYWCCLHLRVCLCQSWVYTITNDPFKLGSPNWDPIVGGNRPWPWGGLVFLDWMWVAWLSRGQCGSDSCHGVSVTGLVVMGRINGSVVKKCGLPHSDYWWLGLHAMSE